MNLEDMLNEISQTQKDKYCIILSMWGTQSNQIHREITKSEEGGNEEFLF
jgi:hypothetical protein